MIGISVGHVLAYFGHRFGGPPQVARSLARSMRGLGVEASFWATGDDQDRSEFREFEPALHLYETRWPRSWYRNPQLGVDLASQIMDLDLLHIHEVWSYPQQCAARLARRAGRPYVVTPSGIFAQAWRFRSLKKRLYYLIVARRMILGASCLHALAQAEVEGFRHLGYRGPIAVVSNGIERSEFHSLVAPETAEREWPELKGRRVVLFLARLAPEKGLDVLIPAWAEIARNSLPRDAILVIAGPDSGGYGSRVRELIDAWRIRDRVLITGALHGASKRGMLARADLFVQPSYGEAFSLSVLEALASQTPVVLTTFCNFPEAVECGAGVCVDPQPESLAEGLRRVLDMPAAARREMGRRGRELVLEGYTWDDIAVKMLGVYRRVLNGRGPEFAQASHRPVSQRK